MEDDDGESFDEGVDFKNSFIAFGVFMFECYILKCMKSFSLTSRGMGGFINMIESNTFNEDYIDRLLGFFEYYKREENCDMENEFVKSTKERFTLLHQMSEMNFVYDFAEDTGDLDGTIEFVKDSYLCYLESLHLCFCHFYEDMKSIVFKEEFLTVEAK
jgi:hypothetical protein